MARTFLIQVTRRDGTINRETAALTDDQVEEIKTKLMNDANVRALDIFQRVFHGHNSFTEDFDPANLMKTLIALAGTDSTPDSEAEKKT